MSRIIGLLLLVAGTVHAGTAARLRDTQATHLFVWSQTLAANVSYTFATSNLSAGADSVLHVQNADDPNGGFIAGNDDFGGTLASSVTLPAVSTSRNVKVVVRAYATSSAGSATFTITPSNGSPVSYPIGFAGTTVSIGHSLAALTHVFTVEQQGGSSDTVMLVVSGTTNGVAFDDDDGVGYMSWVHLDAACSNSCSVIVGSYDIFSQGKTTLIYDEDIHVNNCDQDGMGDALDVAVGADPCNPDTDGDGLSDGAEVIGIDGSPEVKLPYYGADPTKKDLFLETDWVSCGGGNPNCTQLNGAQAAALAALFAPDIAVHADIGVTNSDPASWLTWGNWGGSTVLTSWSDGCSGLTPTRLGYFHHALLGGGGADGALGDYCIIGNTDPRTIAHELGHNLALNHWGVDASGATNWKPHYRSLMNYVYQDDASVPGFSRGQFAGAVLNMVNLDETKGLGTGNASSINFLTQSPWFLTVSATGGVDWNRDSSYNTKVKAPIVLPAGGYGEDVCDHALNNQLYRSQSPVGAWMKTFDNTGRFFLVSRRASDGRLEYRTSDVSNFTTCESLGSGCAQTWTPATTSAPTLFTSTYTGSLGVAAATVDAGISGAPDGDLLVVGYPDGLGKLFSQVLYVQNGVTWESPPLKVGDGSQVTTMDPTMHFMDYGLYLFAVAGGQLTRWQFLSSGYGWSLPEVQHWSDGTVVQPTGAVALAHGYENDLSGQQIYAAIPSGSVIKVARWDRNSWTWTLIQTVPQVTTRVALAFVPFDPIKPSIGHFLLGFVGADTVVRIIPSEDHGTAGHFNLQFDSPSWLYNEWQAAERGINFEYDPRYDTHLRAMWTNGTVQLEPVADALFSMNMKDQDDFFYLRQNLSCSLHGGCPH